MSTAITCAPVCGDIMTQELSQLGDAAGMAVREANTQKIDLAQRKVRHRLILEQALDRVYNKRGEEIDAYIKSIRDAYQDTKRAALTTNMNAFRNPSFCPIPSTQIILPSSILTVEGTQIPQDVLVMERMAQLQAELDTAHATIEKLSHSIASLENEKGSELVRLRHENKWMRKRMEDLTTEAHRTQYDASASAPPDTWVRDWDGTSNDIRTKANICFKQVEHLRRHLEEVVDGIHLILTPRTQATCNNNKGIEQPPTGLSRSLSRIEELFMTVVEDRRCVEMKSREKCVQMVGHLKHAHDAELRVQGEKQAMRMEMELKRRATSTDSLIASLKEERDNLEGKLRMVQQMNTFPNGCERGVKAQDVVLHGEGQDAESSLQQCLTDANRRMTQFIEEMKKRQHAIVTATSYIGRTYECLLEEEVDKAKCLFAKDVAREIGHEIDGNLARNFVLSFSAAIKGSMSRFRERVRQQREEESKNTMKVLQGAIDWAQGDPLASSFDVKALMNEHP